MSILSNPWYRTGLAAGAALALAGLGCSGGAGTVFGLLGAPVFPASDVGPGTDTGGTGGGGGSGFFGGGAGAVTDPCDESLSRKFVRISMRNLSEDSHIHYFFVAVAFIQSETYPNGAVCPDDLSLYTSFGYREIPEGAGLPFGNYCIAGPALVYYHLDGQFRSGGGAGTSSLGSAIAPARGSGSPTYDNFFTSAGAQVPVPNVILFHNPGGASGAALKVSRSDPAPCTPGTVLITTGDCDQDSFYYVDDQDFFSGSAALGPGSGRRVPSEIQGTGCECAVVTQISQGEQSLLPPTASSSNRPCNSFARGGRIDYVFLRDDVNPPIPQLVWRVTDASGTVIHDFDSRVDVP